MNTSKYNTVIDKNTFYFNNPDFQEENERYINSVTETLLNLKNTIDTNGLRKDDFEIFLLQKDNALRALLALTGFANESFKRLITVVRISNDKELSRILYKSKWQDESKDELSEWGDNKINNLLKNNKYFRKAIVNLFFEGASLTYLAKTLPLFELKKLSISKLKFDTNALIDSLVRYKEKGSMSGKSNNNPEEYIRKILQESDIDFENGDLTELLNNEYNMKRTMDFIIPSKDEPKIIIESSFLVTTSSGQGDKAKTEQNISRLIKQYYPKAKFFGFIDGIGWYVRKEDLKRMVQAYDEVFTFHKDEINRFKLILEKELNDRKI